MKQITIPRHEPTRPDQQLHSCGCYFEGMGGVENKAKRRECKMHREMPDLAPERQNYAKDGLEGMY